MSEYFLPSYVYICATPDGSVLLDIHTARYHGLDRKQSQLLSSVVKGWPGAGDVDGLEERIANSVATDLLGKGLLTRDSARGKTAAPVRLPCPQTRLIEWHGADWSTITLAHAGQFAIAYATVRAAMTLLSFERMVERIRQRKLARVHEHSLDIDRTRDLTRIFRTLRPFFYRARDTCLLDSLVLVEFLAMHGMFPAWVIGVKVIPFGAHSWVQLGQHTLNGPPEFIRRFSPILVV